MIVLVFTLLGFSLGILAVRSGFLKSILRILVKYKAWPIQSNAVVQKVSPPEATFHSPLFRWDKYRYASQFDQAQVLFENRIAKQKSKILDINNWQDQEDSTEAYDKTRKHFLDLLGGAELGNPNRVKLLEQELLSTSPSSEIKRVKIQSRIEGIIIEAIVGIPVNPKLRNPAVIALHGYTSSPDKVMGQEEDDYAHGFGKELLEKGYYVIAPFILNHGERVSSISAIASLLGDTIWRIELIKILSCLDFLQQIEVVNNNQIGIYGISGGGLLALYASAVDRRISCTVCSGHLCNSKRSLIDYAIGRGRHARPHFNFRSSYYYVNAPFHLEYPSEAISKMSFPTPILFENGIMDLDLKEYDDEQEYEKIKKYYTKHNKSDRVFFYRHKGAHETDAHYCISWFDRWI
jgi:hypothetical protein